MMSDLKRRVTKLEAAGYGAPLVMHFEDGHTRTPLSMSGSANSFFRIVGEMEKPAFMQSLQYSLVSSAARFEGPGAQLFYLAQALIEGTALADNQQQEEL